MNEVDTNAVITLGGLVGTFLGVAIFSMWQILNKRMKTVADTSGDDIADLKTTQSVLISSNSQLQNEVISLMKTVSRLEKVETERDGLKTKLDETNGKLLESLKTISEQDKVIKDAQIELTSLRNDLRDSQNEKNRLQAHIDGMKDALGVFKVVLPVDEKPIEVKPTIESPINEVK